MAKGTKLPGDNRQNRVLPPNRIAEVRNARGWNQLQLAELVGTSQQSISRYETSQRDFAVSILLKLCSVLEVSASYLLCTDENQPDDVDVPLYGAISAGTPIDMESVSEYYPIPAIVHERFPNAFLLRIEGESMNRILPNGSIALIDPSPEITYDGQPYAVSVNELTATVKRVRRTARGIELIPDSTDPTFETQVLERGVDNATVSVIGRVVWHRVPKG